MKKGTLVKQQQYPILEFDPDRRTIIDPAAVTPPLDVPPHCVLCFFNDIIGSLAHANTFRQIGQLTSEMGPNPIYETLHAGSRLAVVHPGIGAPFAAASLEEMIALGSRYFVVCGGAGVLRKEIAAGHLVIPTTALRDEGTSYRYLPPAREVGVSREAVAAITKTLKQSGVEYIIGKTWTTDAFYRETPAIIAARANEGCVTVEMEAAALFAVAQYRNVPLGQILYGGDDVSGLEWDPRIESTIDAKRALRERVLWHAATACLAISRSDAG